MSTVGLSPSLFSSSPPPPPALPPCPLPSAQQLCQDFCCSQFAAISKVCINVMSGTNSSCAHRICHSPLRHHSCQSCSSLSSALHCWVCCCKLDYRTYTCNAPLPARQSLACTKAKKSISVIGCCWRRVCWEQIWSPHSHGMD